MECSTASAAPIAVTALRPRPVCPRLFHAAIAARIDRLDSVAKRTLNAAAVIGSQFEAELPAILVGETALPQLVQAELIDQIKFTPNAEYVLRHPLIRAVATESQLKGRPRCVAPAAGYRDPTTPSRFGRRESGPDCRAPGVRGRSTGCLRVAHARRHMVDKP